MGLVETSLEVVKLATKLANPELVQTATKANIEALELSGRNLELHKAAEELKAGVKELEAKLALVGEVFRDGDLVFRRRTPRLLFAVLGCRTQASPCGRDRQRQGTGQGERMSSRLFT
jgi:hypothetical protein